MSSSKKDFAIVSKLFMDLINNLSEEQYLNLIKGTADIRYVEKGIDTEKKEIYNNIIYHLATETNLDEKISKIKENEYLSTKSKLLEFCKYNKIDSKLKDTNDTIINNIIKYVDENKDSILYRVGKEENLQDSINKLADKIEETMDIEEAKNIIMSSKCVDSKVNLLKLAKKLNVFIERESTHDAIVDKIIKSVVEAKIRSYTIRKKM